MLDLIALRDFVAVIRGGSFSAAAKRSGVPKSTISKRVQDLELALGVQLIERTTRALRLTPEGMALHTRALALLADAEETLRLISRQASEPEGRLKLSVPLLFGQTRIASIAAVYRARFPKVMLDIVLGDVRVDLIENGFDAAIRVGPLPDSTLIARTFAVAQNIIVAAPSLAEMLKTSAGSPDEESKAFAFLKDVPTLAYTPQSDGGAVWPMHKSTARLTRDIAIEPAITVNGLSVIRDLCLAGAGAALLPQFVVADDLAAGRLIRLMPDWSGPDAALSIVHPASRFMTARLKAFIDLLIEMFPNRSL
jgi:LysR family transcriptional regulator, regulator for bpeEF and oprC